MLDFAGTDAWLRSLAFVGILAGAGILGWWVLTASAAGAGRQAAAVAAMVATIPAAIVAPLEDGAPLTVLGIVAVAAFIACACAALVPVVRAKSRPSPAVAARSAGAARPTSETRVAGYAAATEARPAPAAEQTVALGATSTVREIAFLVEYSAGGRPTRLGADNRLGRDPAAEIPVDDTGASREHARIKLEEGRFVLYDLGSTNGTRLVRAGRRRRISAPAPLADLDIIEIGGCQLVFLAVEVPKR